MNEFNDHEIEPAARRLREERPELPPAELDRIKQTVGRRASRAGGRMKPKTRLATALLVLGLVGSGGGAVIAASGGSSSNGSSANSQYCPESSPAAGKPKHQDGGNKCGHGDKDKGKDKDKDKDKDKPKGK